MLDTAPVRGGAQCSMGSGGGEFSSRYKQIRDRMLPPSVTIKWS